MKNPIFLSFLLPVLALANPKPSATKPFAERNLSSPRASTLVPAPELFARMAPNTKRCFEARLEASSPLEAVTAQLFRDDSTPEYPTFGLELKTQLKSQKKFFSTFFLCSEDSAECSVECDGGLVELFGKDQELEVRSKGFVLSGSCDGSNTVTFPGKKNQTLHFQELAVCPQQP